MVVDLDDGWVVQCRDSAHLLPESLQGGCRALFQSDDLERDRVVESALLRPPNLAHAPSTNGLEQAKGSEFQRRGCHRDEFSGLDGDRSALRQDGARSVGVRGALPPRGWLLPQGGVCAGKRGAKPAARPSKCSKTRFSAPPPPPASGQWPELQDRGVWGALPPREWLLP